MARNTMAESPIWLCLHFDQLPLEVFTRSMGDDRQQPVVVIERHRICRLNQAARDIGIAPGNNMDTAYTLSEQIVGFERDTDKESRHLAHLAQWAYQFTPNISIKAPESLLLDITGCLKLFKGLDSLAEQIETSLNGLGYHPATGVNRTPLAALAVAKAEEGSLSSAKGNTVASSLADLPVTCLSVDIKITEALGQMGINTIGRLLALPADGLSRRFGVFFVDYLTRLIGDKPDPQKLIAPEPKFFSEITFLADVTNTQALIFPIRRLLSELCDFLDKRQLCINRLNWTLSHRSHPTKHLSIHLANPENDSAVFMSLIQLKLDQLDDVKEVDNISLIVHRFFAAGPLSKDLFHGTRYQRKEGNMDANASHLLNLLNTRLGPGTCYGLSQANDHRPENAWRPIHVGQKRWQPAHDEDENPRPVFLLDTPRPLHSAGGYPCLGGQLELLKGPERIDFGWWDESSISKPIARDYYVARQKSGALFWIFNRPGDDPNNSSNRRWYLQGIFS